MAGSRLQKHVFTVVCDHDVVIMPVSYAQHIRGHAVTSAGLDESLHGGVVLQSGDNDQSSYNFCCHAEATEHDLEFSV